MLDLQRTFVQENKNANQACCLITEKQQQDERSKDIYLEIQYGELQLRVRQHLPEGGTGVRVQVTVRQV